MVPFAHEISDLMRESGRPIKIRACDTMGYGVPYPGASLPRSVAGIIYGLRNYGGFPAELLEWHGHNDFYKAVANSATAWLYGAAGVNCSLLGIGERTGNTPLEAMVIEYAQLKGSLNGMDPRSSARSPTTTSASSANASRITRPSWGATSTSRRRASTPMDC